MKKSRIITSSLAAVSLLSVSACVTDPNTGERQVSRTGIGAVVGGTLGYLLGDVVGGSTARIIGAGIGGSAGAVIGKQFDDQIRELDEELSGQGVDVEEIGDQEAILVRLPDGVTFATGSANINPGFYDALNSVASSLQNYPNSLIDVYGFTDTTGSDALNQRLSEQRAQAVSSYLISQGVASARIRSQGFGENPDYFKGDNSTESGRAVNRRVEIKIVPFTEAEARAAQQNQ